MIKEVFILKKDSWHAKLMHAIWGFEPTDFSHICPYFWLSFFNCILIIVGLIPYIIFRIFKPLFRWIGELYIALFEVIDKYCERKADLWIDTVYEKMMEGDISYMDKYATSHKFRMRVYESKYGQKLSWAENHIKSGELVKGGYLTPEECAEFEKLEAAFNKYMDEKRKRNEAKREEYAKRQEKSYKQTQALIARKKRIAAITVKLQSIFKVVGWIIVAAAVVTVGWLLYRLGLIISHLNWALIISIFSLSCRILAGIGTIVLLAIGIKKFICRYGKYCIPCEARRGRILNAIVWFFTVQAPFWSGVGSIFVGIWRGMVSVKDLIVMLYRNNCPPIDWKE